MLIDMYNVISKTEFHIIIYFYIAHIFSLNSNFIQLPHYKNYQNISRYGNFLRKFSKILYLEIQYTYALCISQKDRITLP